ncbi:MAG: hypothetical protein MUF34_18675 [Polyangiaceae bacterium]|nr:hypothetical protein [Polyangiaceae bacterium]
MAVLDLATDKLILHVLYDGVAGAGKTTHLRRLCEFFTPLRRGELNEFADTDGQTTLFKWLRLEGGTLAGHSVRCHLVTMPAGAIQVSRRQALWRQADVSVLVCPNDATRVDESSRLLDELDQARLKHQLPGVPLVINVNHCDREGALPAAELAERVARGRPYTLSSGQADSGSGVRETVVLAMRLGLEQLRGQVLRGGLEPLRGSTFSGEELRASILSLDTSSDTTTSPAPAAPASAPPAFVPTLSPSRPSESFAPAPHEASPPAEVAETTSAFRRLPSWPPPGNENASNLEASEPITRPRVATFESADDREAFARAVERRAELPLAFEPVATITPSPKNVAPADEQVTSTDSWSDMPPLPAEAAATSDAWPDEAAAAGDAWPDEAAAAGDAWPDEVAAASDAWPDEVAVASDAWSEALAPSDAWPDEEAAASNAWSEALAPSDEQRASSGLWSEASAPTHEPAAAVATAPWSEAPAATNEPAASSPPWSEAPATVHGPTAKVESWTDSLAPVDERAATIERLVSSDLSAYEQATPTALRPVALPLPNGPSAAPAEPPIETPLDARQAASTVPAPAVDGGSSLPSSLAEIDELWGFELTGLLDQAEKALSARPLPTFSLTPGKPAPIGEPPLAIHAVDDASAHLPSAAPAPGRRVGPPRPSSRVGNPPPEAYSALELVEPSAPIAFVMPDAVVQTMAEALLAPAPPISTLSPSTKPPPAPSEYAPAEAASLSPPAPSAGPAPLAPRLAPAFPAAGALSGSQGAHTTPGYPPARPASSSAAPKKKPAEAPAPAAPAAGQPEGRSLWSKIFGRKG